MSWFRRRKAADGVRIRCGMCKVVKDYPDRFRGEFVLCSCDADLLVAEMEEGAADGALDLFARAFGPEGSEEEREAYLQELLYETEERVIPPLEDLLYRLKYERASFPPPELASRLSAEDRRPAIDVSNDLEMAIHRMKKYAITKRQHAIAAPAVRPILEDKLARLRTEPLEPIEE